MQFGAISLKRTWRRVLDWASSTQPKRVIILGRVLRQYRIETQNFVFAEAVISGVAHTPHPGTGHPALIGACDFTPSCAPAYNFGLHRFSRRVPHALSPNNFTTEIQKLRQENAVLLDLTVSPPTRVFRDYPHSKIQSAFGMVQEFAYEPQPFGTNAAGEAVADYYLRRGFAV